MGDQFGGREPTRNTASPASGTSENNEWPTNTIPDQCVASGAEQTLSRTQRHLQIQINLCMASFG